MYAAFLLGCFSFFMGRPLPFAVLGLRVATLRSSLKVRSLRLRKPNEVQVMQSALCLFSLGQLAFSACAFSSLVSTFTISFYTP
jgi:hypothetical protein